MASRRSFKSDESFLEKISIGAVGTRRVIEHLANQGYHPIELERGSTSFKIWKSIKIKRIRVPDILCIDNAIRIESRAKTNLDISMSHSFSDAQRGWDYGLEDDDYVALVVCYRSGERPIDWIADELVQYVSVNSLRSAFENGEVSGTAPKGAQEGFEARLIWPSAVAKANGTIISLAPDKLQYRRDEDGRTITLRLLKSGGIALRPLVDDGQRVARNQILASVVDVYSKLPSSGKASEQIYIQNLTSASLSDRYASAKALSYFSSENSTEALAQKLIDQKEHIYVRLEAAAGLSRRRDTRGLSFIKDCLTDSYLEHVLETVIVLGEINTPETAQLLVDTLRNPEQHPEIRAGAAWALGEIRDQNAIDSLIESFLEMEEEIRIEAARALAKLTRTNAPTVLSQFSESSPDKRPGIAWALGKAGNLSVKQILSSLRDDDARRWAAYIIGVQNQEEFLKDIELLKSTDGEVYFAVTVLWQILNSWIYDLEEY